MAGSMKDIKLRIARREYHADTKAMELVASPNASCQGAGGAQPPLF